MFDLKADSDMVAIELRDHLMELYQTGVLGLIKQRCKLNETLSRHEGEWQATCDKLIEEQ